MKSPISDNILMNLLVRHGTDSGFFFVMPTSGFLRITSTRTFYNALNNNEQDSLNSAYLRVGNFLDKMPRDCLAIIESKSKVRYSRNKAIVAKVSTSSSTPGVSPDVAELKDMVRALLLDKKNQSQASQTKHAKPSDQFKRTAYKFMNANSASTSGSGSLPSNTVANMRGDMKAITTQSGVSYDGPFSSTSHLLSSKGGGTRKPRKNIRKIFKTVEPSSDELPELELKDLPPHLEYAFLEGTDKLPVIIAKDLKDEDKTALLKVKSHKSAFAWKISDIKGIDP
ncbi:hypothetical protein Tco_0913887 [Tanacetum coccineum]